MIQYDSYSEKERGEPISSMRWLAFALPQHSLAGPAAEMSRLWMQYKALTPAAGDISKKSIIMLDQYVLVVKHSRLTSSELEVMHKKS
jgi:hypothetical protein